MNQLLERLYKLPRSQRFLSFGGIYILLLIASYFLLISPTLDKISSGNQKNADLISKRDEAQKRAANKPAFEAELSELNIQLKKALRELPEDREIPGLLSDIDGYARKAGLEVRKFRPLNEIMREYYAEVPVEIVMDGSYHEVGVFFDRVSKMNRIVSVADVLLSDPKATGSSTTLTVSGKVVTYRFLTDEEIKRNKEAAEKDKKNKKKGG
jgi:type IV pilus assembly protein PilO